MTVRKDGKPWDTLDNYRYPFLVGGEADRDPVPTEGSWKQESIIVGQTTYLRHRMYMVGSRARISYFIDELWPKPHHESYEVASRILDTHPDLQKMTKKDSSGTTD